MSKNMSSKQKIILLFLLVIVLFGVNFYFLLSIVIKSLEYESRNSNLTQKRSEILSTQITGNIAATINNEEASSNIDEKPDKINPSVFLPIVMIFKEEVFIFQPAFIEDLLGNTNDFQQANNYWNENGESKIDSYLEELFKDTKYNRKSYQMNIHGVDHRDVRGFEYYEQESSPDVSATASMIHAIIDARLRKNSGVQQEIYVRSQRHLGTNGEYSNSKYIELDHSAQKIYAWEGGKLYRSWYASGFFDEFAVFGVFDVKNKALNAWSPIAKKWMPYWMAYYYDNKQQAWFGIHELVYWFDENGNRLGYKKSGGCVRLDRGEMIELYEWAEVGTPFLIYE